MEKSNHRTNNTNITRKLTLPNGSQVGLLNLDTILKEVADLKLTNPDTIKKELLERVKTCNYVASGAENEYASALLREYKDKFEPGDTPRKHTIEPKNTHAG